MILQCPLWDAGSWSININLPIPIAWCKVFICATPSSHISICLFLFTSDQSYFFQPLHDRIPPPHTTGIFPIALQLVDIMATAIDPHTRGDIGLFSCVNKISGKDIRLKPVSLNFSGCCEHCNAFTLKSLRRRLACNARLMNCDHLSSTLLKT